MQPVMPFKAGVLLAFALLLCPVTLAQTTVSSGTQGRRVTQTSPQNNRPRFTKAFIIDNRLSALRRGPNVQSQIINRLRLGRPVYIIDSRRVETDGSAYYRVAVTRRTRGWVHESALAVPGRSGDDARIMKLIESADEELDRIALCQLLIENFSRSAHAPRALLRLGQESERAAIALSQRAGKRLAGLDANNSNASPRDYYLNDSGLDRYNRLQVVFNFNNPSAEYVYDGKAYREIIRRFPNTEEAKVALQRLEATQQKFARQK